MIFHYTFTAESDGERVLKIGQYLAKLWTRVGCLVIWLTGYYYYYYYYYYSFLLYSLFFWRSLQLRPVTYRCSKVDCWCKIVERLEAVLSVPQRYQGTEGMCVRWNGSGMPFTNCSCTVGFVRRRLITYSKCFRQLDLDDNLIGELGGFEIARALNKRQQRTSYRS